MRIAASVTLTPEQCSKLKAYARGRSVARRLVERARIVLFAAEGKQNDEIAESAGHRPAYGSSLARAIFGPRRGRFGEGRAACRPHPTVDAQEIIRKTTQEKPSNATHWSTRSMARAVGVSEASIRRVWQAHGLKPHRVETFKVSRDPHFAEKLEDIVGLYLNPPQHAIVLSVDEKSQIQALDRTQPSLPLKKGSRRNHDARLQAPRHHHAFCCPECAGRQSLESVPRSSHP